MKKIIILISIFFLNGSLSFGNILTVRQLGGADYTDISSALVNSAPGDIIRIIDSSFYNEQISLSTGNNDITIEGAPGQTPTIGNATGEVIYVGEYNVTIRNLKIEVGYNNSSGIYIAAQNVHIDNCEITAIVSGCYGIRAVNNVDGLLVENCRIYGSNIDYGIWLDTIPSGNVIKIQNNQIHNINADGIYLYPTAAFEANTYIVGNEIYDLSGGNGIKVSVKGGEQKIFYNTIYNCSSEKGIYVDLRNANVYIHNNTLVKNYVGLFLAINDSGFSSYIYNNISYHNYNEDFYFYNYNTTNNGVIESYNNHHKVETTITFNSNINYTYSEDIIDQDPLFVDYQANKFELRPESGCIDTGYPIEAYYGTEGFNFKYYGRIDRGSHEYFPTEQDDTGTAAGSGVAVTLDKNSFSPGDTVSIEIDKLDRITSSQKVFVKMEVFDAQGRLVKSLVRKIVSSNTSITSLWNGTDNNNQYVSSGLYLIVVAAGETKNYQRIFWVR